MNIIDGSDRILLVTPPHVYPPDWEEHCVAKGRSLDRKVEITRLYADCITRLGQELSIPVANIYQDMEEFARTDQANSVDLTRIQSLLCDGLHFNAEGNRMLYRCVRKAIDEHFLGLSPDSMKPKVK